MRLIRLNDQTTWWSPKPNIVIDARDIASLSVMYVPLLNAEGGPSKAYNVTLHVYLTGTSQDKREFNYVSFEELNAVLKPLGLEWAQDA